MKALGLLSILLLSIVYLLTVRMGIPESVEYRQAAMGSVATILTTKKIVEAPGLTTTEDKAIMAGEVSFDNLPDKMVAFTCANFPNAALTTGKVFMREGNEDLQIYRVNFEENGQRYQVTFDQEGNLIGVNSTSI